MLTNDLKKGMRVRLRSGWYATIMDNKKGNIRLADVEGLYRDIGSVYSHNIMTAETAFGPKKIEHTPAQIALRKKVELF